MHSLLRACTQPTSLAPNQPFSRPLLLLLLRHLLLISILPLPPNLLLHKSRGKWKVQNDLHSAPLLHSELLHSNSLFAPHLTAEQTLNPPVPLVVFYFASKVAQLNSAFVFCVWWMDLVFLNFIDTSLCSVRAPTSTCQTHFASLRYPLCSTAGTEIFLRSQICRKRGDGQQRQC